MCINNTTLEKWLFVILPPYLVQKEDSSIFPYVLLNIRDHRLYCFTVNDYLQTVKNTLILWELCTLRYGRSIAAPYCLAGEFPERFGLQYKLMQSSCHRSKRCVSCYEGLGPLTQRFSNILDSGALYMHKNLCGALAVHWLCVLYLSTFPVSQPHGAPCVVSGSVEQFEKHCSNLSKAMGCGQITSVSHHRNLSGLSILQLLQPHITHNQGSTNPLIYLPVARRFQLVAPFTGSSRMHSTGLASGFCHDRALPVIQD